MATVRNENLIPFTITAHLRGGQVVGTGEFYQKIAENVADSCTEITINSIGPVGAVYKLTKDDIKEIAEAAFGEAPEGFNPVSAEMVLPDDAMQMLSLDNRSNVDMYLVGEMVDLIGDTPAVKIKEDVPNVGMYSFMMIAEGEKHPSVVGDLLSVQKKLEEVFSLRMLATPEYSAGLAKTLRETTESLNKLAIGEIDGFDFNLPAVSTLGEVKCFLNTASFALNAKIVIDAGMIAQVNLSDEAEEGPDVTMNIEKGGYGIHLVPDNFKGGDKGPVAIDYFNNELKVLIYDDFDEEPTHSILFPKDHAALESSLIDNESTSIGLDQKAIPMAEAKKIKAELLKLGFDFEIGYDKEGRVHICCSAEDENKIQDAICALNLPHRAFYWLGSFAPVAIVQELTADEPLFLPSAAIDSCESNDITRPKIG